MQALSPQKLAVSENVLDAARRNAVHSALAGLHLSV